MAESKYILEVENLTKYFNTPAGQLHAVDGVSFQLEYGKTLGIVVSPDAASPPPAGRC